MQFRLQNVKYRTAVGFNQRLFIFLCILQLIPGAGQAQQNTVGVLAADFPARSKGYDLLYPNNQSKTFLIDQCGRIVHQWLDDDQWRPGNVAYLLESGNLIRAKRNFQSINDPIWFSGGGELVELVSWEGEVLWQFHQNDSIKRIHHDIEPMPNGHILLVSWELKTREEAIEYGRDPSKLLEQRLFPDYVFEVSPEHGDSIFWAWHAWDHVIQDYDPAKPNFGAVADHPELIDLNFDSRNGFPDWLHINSVDYNPELDQIMLSVLGFNEIWIIDHSTTREEAASHQGGRSGRGGDLIYRWGNPQTYRQGSAQDQRLFGQHDAHWLGMNAAADIRRGDIAVFNNHFATDYSAGHVIRPAFDSVTGSYRMDADQWLPAGYERTLTHPQPDKFQSGSVSSIQLLENGNFLLCAGQIGYTIELEPGGGIVWEYVLPLRSGFPVAQGTELKLNYNFIFRQSRYDEGYPAFTGKDLSPIMYLEEDPDESLCELSTGNRVRSAHKDIRILPNPADDYFQISVDGAIIGNLDICNTSGVRVYHRYIPSPEHEIPVGDWPAGIYLIKISGSVLQKVLVIK
ncbi:MAG: aryl-sulfate sulfotransferase [Saprospiraceae bacterium]|nr:aryl-sulfate sulfotransferase [Saprospiraceae bacterium]